MSKKGNDDLIQGTNDLSILSKCSMVSLGYIEDLYIKNFVNKPDTKRSSLINRVYQVRVRAVRSVLSKWLKALENVADKQIVSLGAGFDTSYFYLRDLHDESAFKYVEIDYPNLVKRKMALSQVHKIFLDDNLDGEVDTPNVNIRDSGRYMAIGFNLKNVGESLTSLLESNGVDFTKPTMFLSEVSLVYMKPELSDRVMKWIGEQFSDAFICQLEQIEPDDEFGLVMMEHFEKVACPITSVYTYPNLRTQLARYRDKCGHTSTQGCNLLTFYCETYHRDEKSDVADREQFDEYEGWHRTCCHYSVICTTNSSKQTYQHICQSLIPSQHVKEEYEMEEVDNLMYTDEYNTENFPLIIRSYGHTSVQSPFNRNELLMVGGFGASCLTPPASKRAAHGRLSATVRIACNNRSKLVSSSQLSHPMYATSCITTINNIPHIIVYGGRTSPHNSSSHIRILPLHDDDDVTMTSSWQVVTSSGCCTPAGRWRHTADMVGDRMYVVGGRDESRVFNHVICFHVPTTSWRYVLDESTSTFPALHSHASAWWRDESRLLVSGGLGEEGDCRVEAPMSVFVVDPERGEFERHDIPQLDVRYSHTSHVINNQLLLLGGVQLSHTPADLSIIDLSTWQVVRRIRLGAGSVRNPLHMHGHTSHVTSHEEGRVVLTIVGGGSNCFSFGTSFTNTPLQLHLTLASPC